MPVVTTPADIIFGARNTSIKNRASLATDATELLEKVIRALRGLYAVGARVNPAFYAEAVAVTLASSAWARPEAAYSVWRIERNAQTTGGSASGGDDPNRIAVVPIDDKKAELGRGAVYEYGKAYRTAGNAKDPTGGDLLFFYARLPTSPANINATLDSQWVEAFNDLLIIETALYLAGKDARGDDVTRLAADRLVWLGQYVEFLQHATVNLARRFGHPAAINVQTVLPMLAPAGG